VKKKCKLSLWFFIFIKTVYILTMASLRCTILHIANKPKGCFVSGRFVSQDVLSRLMFCLPVVLSLRTFCLYGHFVSMDVLSHRCFVPRTLCLRLFCLRTFCLRTFCPYGCFVSGRFVWAPINCLSKIVSFAKHDKIFQTL
jgi:hypothetical protein